MNATEAVNQTREKYWVGTTKNCPLHDLSLCGVSFPRRTIEMVERNGILTPGAESPGGIAELTPAEVKRIEKAIEERIFRWTPHDEESQKKSPSLPGKRGRVLKVTDPNFRAREGDRPLAEALIFERVSAEQAAAITRAVPEPRTFAESREKPTEPKVRRKGEPVV